MPLSCQVTTLYPLSERGAAAPSPRALSGLADIRHPLIADISPLHSCHFRTNGWRREGKMTHWMPVLVVGLVVGCVTGYLLLEPKFRQPNREGQKPNRSRRPF